jgi:hypothetical protein
MRLRYSIILALASALVLGSAGPSLATTFSYVATLDGLQEVPPNASPASGSAFLVYDDVANTLTTSISFAGLLAGVSASHIHGPAAPGVAAGVLHGIPSTPFGATSGSYGDVWSGLTAVQVGYLNGSLLYINLHDSLFPGGEIRGQIIPEPVTPTRAVSWGKIKALYR